VAWVTGLAVWPANLDVAASGAKLVAAYTGHQVVAVTQYLLVEGLAAIVLAVVVIASARATRQDGAGRLGSVVALAGIGAVTVSLIECALGLLLAAAAVPDGETNRAGTLFQLINRLDARRSGLSPRWLGYVAALLAAAMIASGVGYPLLSNTLALAAAVSCRYCSSGWHRRA
jgi:hypothetical protein